MIIYGKTDDQLPMLSHYIEVTENKYLMLFKIIVFPSIEGACAKYWFKWNLCIQSK